MSGFKLIGIRPLENCTKRFLKNLKAGKIYQFYNDYEFRIDPLLKEVTAINYTQTLPEDFYYVDRYVQRVVEGEGEPDPLTINICAIVGKNGSGKSALSELFLYGLFIISNNLKFIDKAKFIGLNDDPVLDRLENINYETDVKEITEQLKVELYYLLNESFFILRIENGEISYKESVFSENSVFDLPFKIVKKREEMPPFFYSMTINYSLYGFNTNLIGMWIKAFFHKNDGYQMPVVINPYRDKGIININNENYLTGSRLLANILSIPDYRDVNPKSPIDKIELYIDELKVYNFLDTGESRFTDGFISDFRANIIEPLFNLTFHNEMKYPSIDNEVKKIAEIYLIQKLITIPTRYTIFSNFNRKIRKKDSQDNYNVSVRNGKQYAEELYKDRSHITLKVRQVLNFLRENIFQINDPNFTAKLDLNPLISKISSYKDADWFTDVLDYIPPAFLTSRVKFKDESYFHQLSSGEKQKIYSLNSIIYHLKNIESVHRNKNKNSDENIIAYDTINLILDEVELYYHPEFQKDIISDLLLFVKSASFESLKNINMIFLTHSPFILSDIPHQNILKLDKGQKRNYNVSDKTFGSNIYTLLNDSFYMNNTIGEFAEMKMKKVLKVLTSEERYDEKEKNDVRQTIELIGEPLIKQELEYLFNKKFGNQEVEILKNRILDLENKLKNRNDIN